MKKAVETIFRCSKCKKKYEIYNLAVECYNNCKEKELKEQRKLI